MDEQLSGSRLLAVSGLRNLRDLGGLGAVRPGLLYRSAWLGELTEEGARVLAKFGLRTVFDLRDPIDLVDRPDRTYDLDVVLANFPILPQDGSYHYGTPATQTYALMVDTGGPRFVAALRRLLEPRTLPALVHCAIGRDRTGILIALLLELLGVPEDEIVADYLLSNEGLGVLDGPLEYVDPEGVTRLTKAVPGELLTGALERIRERHGSAEGYLLAHGLNAAEITDLRALLRD
ncbi:tyrosine-protein phosphatase [Kitasatospora kifunensis]|uniref:Protein-tyrosine phosphatase n=1 Tax=Kitasatospora kifunensis TaxID=58351 RepID=A0A7W7VVC1_KITKI|nr:tyrosine-protein phosphatase [Kitasatospora kifunensis]MBB4924237.1 protein-tyrosine phosphatase [Kitasatospora kifunensis]